MARHQVIVRRIYCEPDDDEGYRVLVDALWPRGVSRKRAALDLWLPAVAPSTDLRRWFHHDAGRWDEFQRRYRLELQEPQRQQALDELRALGSSRPLTLLYAARDREHNNAVVLKEVLTE